MSVCPKTGLPCPTPVADGPFVKVCPEHDPVPDLSKFTAVDHNSIRGWMKDIEQELSRPAFSAISKEEIEEFAKVDAEEVFAPTAEEIEYFKELERVDELVQHCFHGRALFKEEIKKIDFRHKPGILGLYWELMNSALPPHLRPESQFQCTGCGG
jgi:hypothetical protein